MFIKMIKVFNQQQTLQIANTIAEYILNNKKAIITLNGDLGSGKTFLTSAIINHIAKTKQLPNQNVVSPTFNILKIYNLNDINIYHYDLYRIKNIEELYELDIETAFDNVAIVEWSSLIEPLLPHKTFDINIKMKENYRVFEIKTLDINSRYFKHL